MAKTAKEKVVKTVIKNDLTLLQKPIYETMGPII